MRVKEMFEGMALGMLIQAIATIPALILYAIKFRPFYYCHAKISVVLIMAIVLVLSVVRFWHIYFVFALLGAFLSVAAGLYLRWLAIERVIE